MVFFKFLISLFFIFSFIFNVSGFQISDVFTAKNISIHKNSYTLEDAKNLAYDDALLLGFRKVASRIISYTDEQKMQKIKSKEILGIGNIIKPSQESRTHKSYSGVLDIAYNPNEFKRVLDNHGIRYKSQYSKELLIIPVALSMDDLFERAEWRAGWFQTPNSYKLLKLNLYNDTLSVYPVNTLSALFNSYKKLKEDLSDEYNQDDLIIVYVDNDCSSGVKLVIRELSPNKDEIKYLIIKKKKNELQSTFIKRALVEFFNKLDKERKYDKAFNDFFEYSSEYSIKVENPKIWSFIKRKIIKLQELNYYNVLRSDKTSMKIRLKYKIPTKSFELLLQRHGLNIVKIGQEQFLII